MIYRFTILALLCFAAAKIQGGELPTLGDSASATISLEQEYQMGQGSIRQLRRYVKSLDDSMTQEYIENLIFRLARYSTITDRRFEFIIIDSPQLNAFAAPGGVIGVNAGLFLHATNEHEFAAVMAHELAHLSQRHFARHLQEHQKNQPVALASLLGSLLLILSDHPEAGFAGLITTQAAGVQSRLAYSRDWEREADRIGMKILTDADFDPKGMPDMFKRMLATYRYSDTPPEFLLTHPISENRIADAETRLKNTKKLHYQTNIDFLYLKTRYLGQYQYKSQEGIKHFEQALESAANQEERKVAQYGLAMAHMRERNYQKAMTFLKKLLTSDPHRILLQASYGDLLIAGSRPKEAVTYLKKCLQMSPNNYALSLIYTHALLDSRNSQDSITILKALSTSRPLDPKVWHLLARAYHLAKDELNALQADAEAMFFDGEGQRAIRQLEIVSAKSKFPRQQRIRQRIDEMKAAEQFAKS